MSKCNLLKIAKKASVKNTLGVLLSLLPIGDAVAQISIDNTFHDELKVVVAQKLGINPQLDDPNYMNLELYNPVTSENGRKIGATIYVWLGGVSQGGFLSMISLDSAGNPSSMEIKDKIVTIPEISGVGAASQSLGLPGDISPDMLMYIEDIPIQAARQYQMEEGITTKSVNNNGDMVVRATRLKAIDDGSYLDQMLGTTSSQVRQVLYLANQTTPVSLAHQNYSNRLACTNPELASVTAIEGLNYLGLTTERVLNWLDPQYGPQTATYYYPASSACGNGPISNYALAAGQSRRLLANMKDIAFSFRGADLGVYNLYHSSEQVILETPSTSGGSIINTGKSVQNSMPENQFGDFNLAKFSPDGEFGISPNGRFVVASATNKVFGSSEHRIVRVDTVNNATTSVPITGAPSYESVSLISPKLLNDGTVAGVTHWSNGIKRMNLILPSGTHLIGSYPADAVSCDIAGITRGRVFGNCTIQNASGIFGPIGYFWNYTTSGVSAPQKLHTIVPLASQGFDSNSHLPIYSVGRSVTFTNAYHPQFGYRQIRLILN